MRDEGQVKIARLAHSLRRSSSLLLPVPWGPRQRRGGGTRRPRAQDRPVSCRIIFSILYLCFIEDI